MVTKIYDRFNRPLVSARISVTHRCNLNCLYCHREGVSDNSREEMTPEEIVRVTSILAKYGMSKVKITGGEPLLRSDICEIVDGISGVDGIEEVSMTTNGVYLAGYASKLKDSGLKRVNVSLDTLNARTFRKITRGGGLAGVLRGVDAAVDAGLRPVKLNMVVMNGINEDEIERMLEFSSKDDVILQLIELMTTEGGFFREHFYDLDEVESSFERKAKDVITRRFMQGRKKYLLNGVQVEVVKPMHNTEFCSHCSRMRITADGKFKPCLMRRDNLVDFLSEMRNGSSDAKLEELFKAAVDRREPFFVEKN
ncbi:MAG: GTP 3',8-cyclase MoaA [Candidatus Hydrothermarchaeales archaeon]